MSSSLFQLAVPPQSLGADAVGTVAAVVTQPGVAVGWPRGGGSPVPTVPDVSGRHGVARAEQPLLPASVWVELVRFVSLWDEELKGAVLAPCWGKGCSST